MRKPPPAVPVAALSQSPTVELILGEVVVLGLGSTGFSMTPAAARQFQEALAAVLLLAPR